MSQYLTSALSVLWLTSNAKKALHPHWLNHWISQWVWPISHVNFVNCCKRNLIWISVKQSRKQEPKGSFYAWYVVVVKIIIKPKMWKLIFKITPPPKLAWRSAMWWRHYQAAILRGMLHIWNGHQNNNKGILFITLQSNHYNLDLLIVGETRPFKN